MSITDYIDHTLTTQRDWTRARSLHRKKLQEIVRTPSNKAHRLLPNFFSESKSRERSQRNCKLRKENQTIFSKISTMSPAINTNIRAKSSTPRFNNSLYGGFESNEKKRVKNENRKLAMRIIKASPSFTVKDLNKRYIEVLKLKKNICKPHSLTSKFANFPIIRGQSLHRKKGSEFSTSVSK